MQLRSRRERIWLMREPAAQGRRSQTDVRGIRADTPPPSDLGLGDVLVEHSSLPSLPMSMEDDPQAPPPYTAQEADWFQPGRLFRIWAPKDVEIHDKEFVLLDTKNIEGPGLRIRVYSEEEEQNAGKGYFLRSHVLVQNHDQKFQNNDLRKSRRKIVYLDEYVDEEVEGHTWIELEHQYNIPFVKYKCIDCGMLDRSSLKDLRRSYVDWLRYHWNLE